MLHHDIIHHVTSHISSTDKRGWQMVAAFLMRQPIQDAQNKWKGKWIEHLRMDAMNLKGPCEWRRQWLVQFLCSCGLMRKLGSPPIVECLAHPQGQGKEKTRQSFGRLLITHVEVSEVIGVPPNHLLIHRIFPQKKTSILGTPFMETSMDFWGFSGFPIALPGRGDAGWC